MLARLVLIAFAFCVFKTAIAAESALASDNFCRQQLPSIRDAWLHNVFDTSPAVAAVMVDAIDGKLPLVRQGLAALPATKQARWRQVAMLTAASSYQPGMVDGLLDDGAAVDAPALLPPFKQAFANHLLDAASHDPRFGGPATIEALQSQGLVDNKAKPYGPALVIASHCDDVATLDVLLRHQANVMARAAPNSADALTMAVVDGNAPIASRLLDHGADVCADNRRIRKPNTSLASIGQRHHLPDALVQRMTCHAPAVH